MRVDPKNIEHLSMMIDDVFPTAHGESIHAKNFHLTSSDVYNAIARDYFWLRPSWWVQFLFNLRKFTGMLFRIDNPDPGQVRGNEIKFAIGERVLFFTVLAIDEQKEIVLANRNKIIESVFSFYLEPLGAFRTRLYNKTKVRFLNIFGQIYWYLILPFHHLIIESYLNQLKKIAEKKYASQQAT